MSRGIGAWVLLCAALCIPAAAQEHPRQLMGTVQEHGPQALRIRTPDGSDVTIGLDADTRWERDGKTARPTDLAPGIRVVVEAEEVEGRFVARLVRIGVKEPPRADHEEHAGRAPHAEHASTALGLPHAREGSGTAWLPDTTPMHAVHRQAGSWEVMLHGALFAGYDHQGSDRGDEEFTSVNWGMLMAWRPLAGGEFGARAMLSLEPLTTGDDGYPLLLQTGESLDGIPLHDRQHPHDLFMEAAVTYARPIADALALQLYAAAAGEPALGPVAFPHRPSAASDPLAPLSHHWQDSSHITFGVLTAGVFTRRVKLEGSWFNGREPDEERWDFDFREFDSFSGRFSVNPTERLSLQASFGYLASPEALEPETSLHRLTISAARVAPFRSHGMCAATAVWGRNDPSGKPATNALLLEGDLDLDGRNTIFGRVEWIEKSGEDLVLPPPAETKTFDVGSLVLGYLRDFGHLGLGLRASVDAIGDDLRPFYGTNWPAGAMLFLRLRPAGGHDAGMHH